MSEVVEAAVGELCALEVQGGSELVMQPTGPSLETQVLWPSNSMTRKNEGNDKSCEGVRKYTPKSKRQKAGRIGIRATYQNAPDAQTPASVTR